MVIGLKLNDRKIPWWLLTSSAELKQSLKTMFRICNNKFVDKSWKKSLLKYIFEPDNENSNGTTDYWWCEHIIYSVNY